MQQIQAVRWLLAHGANSSIKDRDGRTVSDYVNSYVPEEQRETFFKELDRASVGTLR
jgi:hypothetical protein